jgi:hypothetical protein
VNRGKRQIATGNPAEWDALGRIQSALRTRLVIRAHRLFVVATLLHLSCRAIAADDAVTATIVLVPANSPQAAFEVRGLSADLRERLAKIPVCDLRWPQILGITVSMPAAASAASRLPPMLGKYAVTHETVRFQPRFPLERGVEYRAVFRPPPASGTSDFPRIERTFVLPATSLPPTRVVAIYPSSRELPENLLRFYLKFSAPMSQGKSYGYVRLRDETGSEIARPFLELPQELWSPDGTRLTLLFEPGRVKRGLVPRAEEGSILTAGRSYTLTIDANWPDAEGRPLKEPATWWTSAAREFIQDRAPRNVSFDRRSGSPCQLMLEC